MRARARPPAHAPAHLHPPTPTRPPKQTGVGLVLLEMNRKSKEDAAKRVKEERNREQITALHNQHLRAEQARAQKEGGRGGRGGTPPRGRGMPFSPTAAPRSPATHPPPTHPPTTRPTHAQELREQMRSLTSSVDGIAQRLASLEQRLAPPPNAKPRFFVF